LVLVYAMACYLLGTALGYSVTVNEGGTVKKAIYLSLVALTFALISTPVMATPFSTGDPNTSVSGNGGLPVSSTAEFLMGTDNITITLTNTLANPKSVSQNLSDLAFYFATTTGEAPTGTLTSSSGLERSVASNGSYTDGSVVPTGWVLSAVTGGLYLNVLGTPVGPEHTIIGSPNGSNVYSNANRSIANNDPHNPFLAGPVTFNIYAPGVTAATTINSVWFSYGTAASTSVPEPTTLLLLGLGLLGVAGIRRKFNK
jgi:hypothetical protein